MQIINLTRVNARNPSGHSPASVQKHATARPKSGRLRSNLMAYKICCFLLYIFAIKLLKRLPRKYRNTGGLKWKHYVKKSLL